MDGVKVEQSRAGPEIAIPTFHGHKNDGASAEPRCGITWCLLGGEATMVVGDGTLQFTHNFPFPYLPSFDM